MRKLLKVLAWLGCLCLLAVVALAVVAWHALGAMCANDVLAEVRSPDGEHKVVVFQRACGATTGFSTQLSLIPSQQALDNASGNIFVADTDHGAAPRGPEGGPSVVVRWLGSDALEVVHHPKARVFFASPEESGVRITIRAAAAFDSAELTAAVGDEPSPVDPCFAGTPIVLEGVLTSHQEYGPPGWGDDPATDSRWTLVLLKVSPDRAAQMRALLPGCYDEGYDLSRVQLSADEGIELAKFEGAFVRVTGLLTASTGAPVQVIQPQLEVTEITSRRQTLDVSALDTDPNAAAPPAPSSAGGHGTSRPTDVAIPDRDK